jgi:hypothetical protein
MVSQKVVTVVALVGAVAVMLVATVVRLLVVTKPHTQDTSDQTWEMLWPIPAVAPQGELVNLTTQDQWGMVAQILKVALVVM